MTVDIVTQNTESIIELSERFEEFQKKKSFILREIEIEKGKGNKEKISTFIEELESITDKIEKVKLYIIKLIINNQKVIEEEKQSIQ